MTTIKEPIEISIVNIPCKDSKKNKFQRENIYHEEVRKRIRIHFVNSVHNVHVIMLCKTLAGRRHFINHLYVENHNFLCGYLMTNDDTALEYEKRSLRVIHFTSELTKTDTFYVIIPPAMEIWKRQAFINTVLLTIMKITPTQIIIYNDENIAPLEGKDIIKTLKYLKNNYHANYYLQ